MANSYALFEWFSGISSATTSNIFMQLGHMSEKMKMKLLQKTTSSYLLPFMRSLGPEIAKIDKTLWMSQNQRNVILFFHDYKSSQVRNSHYLFCMKSAFSKCIKVTKPDSYKKNVSPKYFDFCLQNRAFWPLSRNCFIRFCWFCILY